MDWKDEIQKPTDKQYNKFLNNLKQRKMKKKLIEMPKEVFEKIEAEAKKNDRSVNKQITFYLKKAVEKK